MEWLLGAALLPLLACGLMCVGGFALAAIGLRRRDANNHDCCSNTDPTHEDHPQEVEV